MRKLLLYISFILLSISVYSQSQIATSGFGISVGQKLYITGQKVKVVVFSDSVLEAKILFVDLISSDNSWVIGAKYEISKPLTTFDFSLPTELISGIYLLRVYEDFNKKADYQIRRVAIKVVNPYNPKTIGVVPLKKSNYSPPKSHFRTLVKTKIVENKSRDSIKFILNGSQDIDVQQMVVSLVPEFAAKEILFQLTDSVKPQHKIFAEDGLILSGNIHHRLTGEPMKNKNLHLSIPQLKNVFFTKTDSVGRFHFNLNYSSGSHPIYINIDDTLLKEAVIEVNRDFLLPEAFATTPFTLDSVEKKNILLWVQRREIKALFNKKLAENKKIISFYGHADKTIVLDDYVDLFTLKEYFKEVPGNVMVRKVKRHRELQLTGENPQLQFMKPLVLLDFIPVYDMDKILDLNISQIQRYEIVNELYVRDSRVFGGVLNIISRRENYANYTFPATAKFVPYSLLIEENIRAETLKNNQPIFKNPTLLHQINLTKNPDKYLWISPFSLTDKPYRIKVVYLLKSGEIIVEERVL